MRRAGWNSVTSITDLPNLNHISTPPQRQNNVGFAATTGTNSLPFFAGGRTNPGTGIKGDWSGTVFQAIYETTCGMDETQSKFEC